MIWSKKNNIKTWLPKLQSHRGYCLSGASQNSLESVKTAYNMGYQMAEFDVRLTADRICILFHDSYLGNKKIRRTTLKELRSQIAVSTLEEVFVWFVETKNFKLNIEIKSRDIFNFGLEKKIAGLISLFKIEDRVLISSFNPFSLYKIRLFCPDVFRAILLTLENDHGNNIFTRSLSLNYLCRPHILNLRYSDYSEKFKELAKTVPVVLWTVNDLSYFKKIAFEIHGIISDVITPEDLKEVDNAEIH